MNRNACFNYVESGLFDEERRDVLRSLAALASLGTAIAGDLNRELTYLVRQRSGEVIVRAVAQRKGGTKYAIDQLNNPHTIVFRPGGTHSDTTLIAGSLGMPYCRNLGDGLWEVRSHLTNGTIGRVIYIARSKWCFCMAS